MIFSRPFLGVARCCSRAAHHNLFALLLAVVACGGASDGSDVDEAAPPVTTKTPSAPASTSQSAPSSTSQSSAGPAAPSPPVAAPAMPTASPPAPAPSAAPETAAPGASAGAEATEPGAQLTFAKNIWPIFNSKCGPCHVTERLGGHNVGSEDLDIALEAALERQDDILRELRSKAMPPGCARVGASADKCVSSAELDQIASWYSQGSPR